MKQPRRRPKYIHEGPRITKSRPKPKEIDEQALAKSEEFSAKALALMHGARALLKSGFDDLGGYGVDTRLNAAMALLHEAQAERQYASETMEKVYVAPLRGNRHL